MKCTSLPLLARREFITLLGGAAAGVAVRGAGAAGQQGRSDRLS